MAQGVWRLAYDVATQPFLRPDTLVPLIFPAIGVVLVSLPQRIIDRMGRRPEGPMGRAFRWFWFLFGSLVAGVFVISYATGRVQLLQAERSGRLEVAEGCLTAFHPMPYEGHQDEVIVVAGKTFVYSDYRDGVGFGKTESHGGPIHADTRVRLAFRGDYIARVEVQPHACPPAPDPGYLG